MSKLLSVRSQVSFINVTAQASVIMIHLCRKIVEYYILFLCYTYYIVEYNTLLLCIHLEELLTNGLDNSFLMGKSKTESRCPQYKLLSIIVSTSKYLRASDNISTYLPCSDCFVAGVKARLPILGWLPHYNLNDAVSDAIAGVTVGLTVIPQGDVTIP